MKKIIRGFIEMLLALCAIGIIFLFLGYALFNKHDGELSQEEIRQMQEEAEWITIFGTALP